MQIEDLESLRRYHPAWRLLRAEHAPLVIGFLGRIFIEQNTRTITAADLISLLDDELYRLNQQHAEPVYPKQARNYLDGWASPESGWLRKFYPTGSDDASFDVTSDLEKAYGWGCLARGSELRRHGVSAQHGLRAAAADGGRRRERSGGAAGRP